MAVKVLHLTHANDEALVARFKREMRLCARLYHPHIVRLIDSGRTDEGQLYTVFEYVPGRNLGDVLATEGALPPWEAAHLMLQVLDALGCAHKLGIVHRDLKPQNIMLTSTGVRRNALVLDFGLGTLSDEDRREDQSRITLTRDTLGTPAYAAPEQLRGEPVTARTDLYAWGLIFLECLTGKRVVEGSRLQELIFKQLGSEPFPLPEWLGGHPLGRLLRRAMEKNPQARDVTAQGLLLELESCATQGWPSADAGASQSMVEVPQLSMGGERRQLTALCCSLRLVGEAADQGDVEDLDGLLWAQHMACVELARRREAWLGGILGDQLLLYFGYPRAQEGDARRAAHVALELMAEMEQRGVELARSKGLRLEVRIGVHTGLVISRELQGHNPTGMPVLAGRTPSVAERLASRARPGEILVSAATAKMLREGFTLEPSGGSGAEAAMHSVPVLRLRGRHRSLASGLEGTPTGPLFGRTLELELLRQRWRQAQAGTGLAILITGEPGIGKSRLAQELLQQARDTPHTFLECRCAPEKSNSTLRPVVELLERMLGLDRSSTAEQAITALEALLSRHGFELPWAVPLLASLLSLHGTSGRYPLPAMSPQRQKEETFQALLDLVFTMAEQQPVLWVVEDLHWADPTTLELLSALVKDAANGRVLVVLTATPEFMPPWPSAQVHRVQLARLERSQVEEMVRWLTREAPLPGEVVERVVERAEGVPLFIEELTRVVVESLHHTEGPRESVPGSLEIPSTLRDLLMARLDRLGPAKATVQLASALGREFSYELLVAASAGDEETVRKDLDTLMAADLVHRRRGTRSSVYVFKHALIRDTAYESMVKPLRRQVHARIAVALELRFPELVQQRPDLLARHRAAADQKREALGYAHKAALMALMRSAYHEALGHATEALEWLDAIPDERERARQELELSGVITPALMSTRGWTDDAVKARVERSQALIDLLGDSPHAASTLWALASYYQLRGEHAQARALAERLVSMEGLKEDASHQAVALPLLAECLRIEGWFVEARGCATRALALWDDLTPKSASMYAMEPRLQAMMCLGLVQWHLGFPDQAEQVVESALAMARGLNHASTLAVTSLLALMLYHLQEDLPRFTALSEQLLKLTAHQRLVSQGAYAQFLRCWGARDLEGMRQSLTSLDEQGSELSWPFYSSMVAEVEAALGWRQAALQRLDEGLRRARASGDGLSLLHLLYRQGALQLVEEPDSASGEARLREALDLARKRSAKMVELRAALPLCTLLLRRGQRTEARELLAPLYAGFTEGFDAPDLVRARHLLEEIGS